MTLKERCEFLQKCYIFQNLSAEKLNNIASVLVENEYSAQTLLIEQDTLDTSIYFIVFGRAHIFRINSLGDKVSIGVRKSGEIIGEMALFNNFLRTASVKLLDESILLSTSAEKFLHILYEYPEVTVQLLQSTTRQHFELAHDIAGEKVANLFDRVAFAIQTLGKLGNNGELPVDLDELALIVGASRKRLIDIIKDMQERGQVILNENTIIVVR